jgi:pimeloyl-ACP methyl ester carboxylesterase
MANHFNRFGVAVLAYDKRGVGESGGVYVGRENGSERNLTLLARDAAAGVAFVRAQPAIDQSQIGLWGVSQAGWIVPMAAVFDGEVAFTVLISGPTVTVGEENYYSDLTHDSSAGLAELDMDEVSRLLTERGPFGFDPRPYLEKMDMPGLWLLGSADESIPIPETVAILDDLIGNRGKLFSYRVWEGADHGLRVNGRTVGEFWAVQNDFLFDDVALRVEPFPAG